MLFFVTGEVIIENDVELTSESYTGFDSLAQLKRHLKANVRIRKEENRQPILKKGSVVAYSLQKLEVDPTNGRLRLPVGKMAASDEMSFEDIDPGTEIESGRSYYSTYFGKLLSDDEEVLRKALKELLSTACMPRPEPSDKSEDFERRDDTEEGCDETGNIHFLRLIKKRAKAALPTTDDKKEKEIEDLLMELGVPGLLHLSKEGRFVYGIMYFMKALLHLPPQALPWLRDCANESGTCDVFQAVNELEKVLHCLVEKREYSVDGIAPNVQNFIAFALQSDMVLNAWHDAYVSAIFLCGLPVTSASA